MNFEPDMREKSLKDKNSSKVSCLKQATARGWREGSIFELIRRENGSYEQVKTEKSTLFFLELVRRRN